MFFTRTSMTFACPPTICVLASCGLMRGRVAAIALNATMVWVACASLLGAAVAGELAAPVVVVVVVVVLLLGCEARKMRKTITKAVATVMRAMPNMSGPLLRGSPGA